MNLDFCTFCMQRVFFAVLSLLYVEAEINSNFVVGFFPWSRIVLDSIMVGQLIEK
jgi:hypothetical protein